MNTWVEHAHGAGRACDISCNPNRPWYLLTSGEDGEVHIWDARAASESQEHVEPVLVLRGHEHWATCGRYNPFHDQLAVSGGTDGAVVMWRISSVSSAPLVELEDEEEERDEGDDARAPAAVGAR